MKRTLLIGLLWICASPLYASDEILFNTDFKKGVLDVYTDPNVQIWERFTNLHQLCYKNAEPQAAMDEIMRYYDEGLLFDFDTEDYKSMEQDGAILRITVLNGKMMDDGLEEEEAYQTHDIGPCTF